MLKRPRDAFDTSPASSTPPSRPMKAIKRYHMDSDAFSDASAFHLPSDSPSNPFGRFRPFVPRDLPLMTPISEHLVLRFQLSRQRHSVYRVVVVPANYTFWHLHRLTQFLFNWKDIRIEKHPDNKHLRVQRRAEHIFTVRKRISFHVAAKSVGLFKEGTDVMRIAGNIKELRPLCNDDLRWEREECYTLAHLWNKPSSISNALRGIVYDFDPLSSRRATVHISLYDDTEKVKGSIHDLDELGNTPRVVLGSGLPDDDDDDEDFALDLQQFNESNAFEDFIHNQEDPEEDQDDCPSIVRLAEEQALVKKRMSASLPEHLPLDDDLAEEAPSNELKHHAKVAFMAPLKAEKHPRPSARLPEPEESCEAGASYSAVRELSPVKKDSDVVSVHLPDPEESLRIRAGESHVPHIESGTRKRMPRTSRNLDPKEGGENGKERSKAPHKRGVGHIHASEESHEAREALRGVSRQKTGHMAQRKRVPLEPRVPDAEDSDEDGADVQVVPRKRIASLVPHHPNAEDEIRTRAKHVIEARRRASMVSRLPDPDESREIGDDRPSKPVPRRVSLPSLLNKVAAHEVDDGQDEEYITAGPFRHKRRHAPLRGARPRRKSVEPSIETEDDEENDENAEVVESEAEV